MKIQALLTPILANTLFVSLVAIAPAHAAHHESKSAEVAMSGENNEKVVNTYIGASETALQTMFSLPMDEPIYMLNMIRLKDKAVYENGSEFSAKDWTGAEAYAEYRRHAGPIAESLGGKSIYEGISQLTLIGPEYEKWDFIFIVFYPNVNALQSLTQDPIYQRHAFHRAAGVADSRLIRMASPPAAK